jgi:hypothetical protein
MMLKFSVAAAMAALLVMVSSCREPPGTPPKPKTVEQLSGQASGEKSATARTP